jgi:hypothetical protein
MRLRMLVVAVMVLTGIHIWLSHRETDQARLNSARFLDQPLLEVDNLERANRIVIREKPQSKVVERDRDGYEVRLLVPPDAPIRETILEKDATGTWRVANRYGLVADTRWLGQIFSDLAQGQLVRYVTRDSTLLAELDLHLAQVRLEDADGHLQRRLDFGRKDGSSRYQFVQVDNAEAYLARHETELLGDPLIWVQGRVFGCQVTDVRSVRLSFRQAGEPPLSLTRRSIDEPWQTEDGAALPAAAGVHAERLLGKILTENIAFLLPPTSEAAQAARAHPQMRLEFSLFSGQHFTVTYGQVPTGDPSKQELEPHDESSLLFAQISCSDPQALAMQQSSRAALGYNRSSLLLRVPENRAALEKTPSPEDTRSSLAPK